MRVILLCALLLPCVALAADGPLSDECKKLIHDKDASAEAKRSCLKEYYKVVVTANRYEEQLKNIPASVGVVAGRNLERPSSDSVAAALSDMPGVDVSDAGELGLKRIRVRGEDASRITVLIDGQEFFDPRDVGTPILMSPEMVERIEVLRGPASTLYGSRAIGGVINIITKRGGHHPAQATASSLYDSNTDGWQQFGSIYGGWKGLDYRVAVAAADHGDMNSADGYLDDTAYNNSAVLAHLGYAWDNHRIAFQYSNFDGESDVYVEPEVRMTPPFLDFRIDAPQRDREKYSWFYDYEDRDSNILQRAHVDFYLQDSSRQFDTFSKTAIDPAMLLVSNTSIYSHALTDGLGGNAFADFSLSEQVNLMGGVQVSQEDLDQSRLREVAVGSGTPTAQTVLDQAALDMAALYLVGRYKFIPEWELALGGRNYWVDQELEATTRSGLDPQSSDDTHLVGNASLAYSGIENTLLWLKFAQGYQYATLSQSATGAFAGPSFVNPNFELDPETSNEFELGGRFDDGKWGVDAAVFYARADDYIDHVLCSSTSASCVQPTGTRDRVYVNIDEATTFGAELGLSYNLEPFTPYGSVTWLRREFDRGTYATYDTGLAAISSRIGLQYEHDLEVGATWWGDIYARMSTDSDEFDGSKTQHKAGWMTLNAAAGIDFGEKRQYKLALELLNIFDKQYTPATENLPGKGFAALVRATVDL